MELQRRQPTYKKMRQVIDIIERQCKIEGRKPALDDLCSHFPSVDSRVLDSLWRMDLDARECASNAAEWLQDNLQCIEEDIPGNFIDDTSKGIGLTSNLFMRLCHLTDCFRFLRFTSTSGRSVDFAVCAFSISNGFVFGYVGEAFSGTRALLLRICLCCFLTRLLVCAYLCLRMS